MIETVGLTRRFGEITAVQDLTLSIDKGQVFGFLGPNGAGKTTTVRMLCCLINPTSGSAFVDGLDISEPSHRIRIREKIGLLPEVPGLYESLSAYRNLDFFAQLYGISRDDRDRRIRDLLTTLDVWDRRDDPVAKFSKGMRQKIAIARALIHEPEYLFLDEPTSGLDPQAAMTVRNYLLDLKREGHTIFLNTHNLDDAERLCDTIGVLKNRLLDIGSPEGLSRKFYGRTTVVHLATLTDRMVDEIGRLDFVKSVRKVDGKLLIDLDEPELQNPKIVSLLISMGGEVLFVNELKHGLENVYLKLIEGT